MEQEYDHSHAYPDLGVVCLGIIGGIQLHLCSHFFLDPLWAGNGVDFIKPERKRDMMLVGSSGWPLEPTVTWGRRQRTTMCNFRKRFSHRPSAMHHAL